jgi:hypothetical protein
MTAISGDQEIQFPTAAEIEVAVEGLPGHHDYRAHLGFGLGLVLGGQQRSAASAAESLVRAIYSGPPPLRSELEYGAGKSCSGR